MAGWCIKTGQAPAVWLELTQVERLAFLEAAARFAPRLR